MKNLKNFFFSLGLMLGVVLYNASMSIASQFTLFVVTQNPVTGRMKGKFANAVFATQFGKNTMRSKPLEVRNPQTASQQNNRSIFSTAVMLGGTFLQIIKIGYQKVAIGMSPYNYFVGDTAKNAISGTVGAIVITWANIKIAAGTLMGVVGQTFSYGTGNFTLGWTDNTGAGNALATDIFEYIIYNADLDQSIVVTGVAHRDEESATTAKPSLWLTGHKCYAYGFYKSADGSLISDSVYFGTATI